MIDVARYRERFERELAAIALPEFVLVERAIETPPAIADIPAAVASALASIDVPRGRVAIGVGSRGIARLPAIVAALVARLRAAGADPFVVPAMGSHGASTAAGQAEVLAHLGIDEARVGAPVRSTMDVVRVGATPDGLDVFMDAYAYAADAVVVVNRVKPHTSFRASLESGPAKMLAIGLGKAEGARSIHSLGWGGMAANVRAGAEVALGTGKIAFALALVENADEEICEIEAIPAARLLEREPYLLERAKRNLARLPFEKIDVLVVDRVGKRYSGTGADPNVTGRYPSEYVTGGADVTRLVYLALDPEGDGNANGIGLADVVGPRLAETYDPLSTYLNALTTTAAPNSRLPMVMPTDELAVRAALRMCPGLDSREATCVRIESTLALQRMWLSPAARRTLGDRVRVMRGPVAFERTTAYAS